MKPDPSIHLGKIFIALALIAVHAGPAYSDDAVLTSTRQKGKTASVLAVGDIMLSGSAREFFRTNGYDHAFGDRTLARIISSADVAFANLEYPVTDSGARYRDKTYTFRGDAESLTAIKRAGFDLLSLANNHIMDYGEAGMKDTMEQCRKNRLAFTGAGSDPAKASRLALAKRRKTTYGLLAYSFTFPEEFWADCDRPGTAHPDWAQVGRDIRDARPKADILMVSFHWGEELKSEPKRYQIDFARHALDSGADMVLGHHPHIPQPIEIYKGKPIFYSLGNYAFGSVSLTVACSFAAETRFKDHRPVQVVLYPINVNNLETSFQPRAVTGVRARRIIEHLTEISREFGTDIRVHKGTGRIEIPQIRMDQPLAASKDMSSPPKESLGRR